MRIAIIDDDADERKTLQASFERLAQEKGPSGNPLGDSTRRSRQLNAAARYSPTPSRVQYHRRARP